MSPRLYKRGRTWWSDLYVGGRRVRKPLAQDKRVAEERLADLIKDREAQRYGHAPRDVRWPDFKAKYLAWSEGAKAATTFKRDRMALSSLEKFHSPRFLHEIRPEMLERWKAERRASGRGNATINRDLCSVKSMMRKALDWGYVRDWRGASVKKLKQTEGRLLFYTPEELGRLLTVCRSRFSAFYDWETLCLLGSRAGLRRSEIYWLSWEDVDLKRRLISIHPKDGWQPKTGEQRHIPMPADLTKHLVKNHHALGDARWVLGDRPSLAVMSAFFRKISRKAKLAGNIHTLRHTYASHLVQAGVDLYTVSKLLGHKDVNMTRRYAHLAPKTLEDAVAKLPTV